MICLNSAGNLVRSEVGKKEERYHRGSFSCFVQLRLLFRASRAQDRDSCTEPCPSARIEDSLKSKAGPQQTSTTSSQPPRRRQNNGQQQQHHHGQPVVAASPARDHGKSATRGNRKRANPPWRWVCIWSHGARGTGGQFTNQPPKPKQAATSSRRQSEPPAMGRTSPTLRRAWPKDGPLAAICVQNVDVQCVLQFTLIHAAGCVLHRRTSRVIHRLKLFLTVSFLLLLSQPREGKRESTPKASRRPLFAKQQRSCLLPVAAAGSQQLSVKRTLVAVKQPKCDEKTKKKTTKARGRRHPETRSLSLRPKVASFSPLEKQSVRGSELFSPSAPRVPSPGQDESPATCMRREDSVREKPASSRLRASPAEPADGHPLTSRESPTSRTGQVPHSHSFRGKGGLPATAVPRSHLFRSPLPFPHFLPLLPSQLACPSRLASKEQQRDEELAPCVYI